MSSNTYKNDYEEWMLEEVEPYLKKLCRYGSIQGRDGASIFYQEYKLPYAEECIVISHGFCEFAEKYAEVIYRFLEAGYSVYIPEHRGHGRSERIAKDPEMVHIDSYETYVQDFVGFVEQVVVPAEEHRILYAHSMGGAIGTLTLEKRPDLFERAVLSAPMFGMQTGRWPGGIARITSELLCLIGKAECYAPGQSGFCEKPDFAGSSCVSKERYYYIYSKRIAEPLYRTYGGSSAWVRASLRAIGTLMCRKNLANIQCPILLFGAGADHMVKLSALEKFAEQTKQTRYVLMPEAKHEIYNANDFSRREYYEAIFEFLKQTKKNK